MGQGDLLSSASRLPWSAAARTERIEAHHGHFVRGEYGVSATRSTYLGSGPSACSPMCVCSRTDSHGLHLQEKYLRYQRPVFE